MTARKSLRRYLVGGAAATALATSFALGGIVAPTTPVLAEAVRVEAPKAAPSFADVVEAVSPAVVSVRVKSAIRPTSNRGLEQFGLDDLPESHPFRRFFEFGPRFDREFRNRRGERRRAPRRFGSSQGSGFFVSDDGYIVTNNHVIEKGTSFTVVMTDGTELDAKLVGTDPKSDLAVLKVDEKRKFTYVSFSKQENRVGDWVVAVGNPFGLGGTVTAGIVSASNRDIGSGPYDDFIQIDAAVNKGNSGGPAFNLNGEVIGVNTAIFSPSGGNVGIAFAISAKSAEKVVNSLISDGSVTRGWLGVQIQSVTKDIAESIGLDEASGAIVAETQPGSPAEDAGLESGDVIVKVDDEAIEDPRELARVIAAYAPDEVAKVTVFRDGSREVIDVKLGKLPQDQRRASAQQDEPAQQTASVELEQLGLSVAGRGNNVVVADVEPGSVAEEKGVRSGDVIRSINGRDTDSVQDVGKAVADAMEADRKAMLFQLESNDRSRFVALPVAKG